MTFWLLPRLIISNYAHHSKTLIIYRESLHRTRTCATFEILNFNESAETLQSHLVSQFSKMKCNTDSWTLFRILNNTKSNCIIFNIILYIYERYFECYFSWKLRKNPRSKMKYFNLTRDRTFSLNLSTNLTGKINIPVTINFWERQANVKA